MATAATATDWLSRTIGGRRAQCVNIRAKLASHKTELDLTDEQVVYVNNLCDEYVAIVDYVTAQQATASGLNEWRDTAITGKGGTIGDALPDPAAFAGFTNDADYIVGIIPELRRERDGWTTKAGWTQAIGEDLMVVRTEGGNLPEEEVTPTIIASGAQSGYVISVMVKDREGADQFVVETRQKGGDWQSAGTFTGRTTDITITPLSPGDPEQVEVRVRLKKNNENYGNTSQTATVTVNP